MTSFSATPASGAWCTFRCSNHAPCLVMVHLAFRLTYRQYWSWCRLCTFGATCFLHTSVCVVYPLFENNTKSKVHKVHRHGLSGLLKPKTPMYLRGSNVHQRYTRFTVACAAKTGHAGSFTPYHGMPCLSLFGLPSGPVSCFRPRRFHSFARLFIDQSA